MNFLMAKINIGCNVIVINRLKQILLGLRKNCKGAGTYGLPGGHVHYGEKLIVAAKREVKEECGITSSKINFTSITDDKLSREKYIQINFLIEEYEGKVQLLEPDKCEKWSWFELDKLPTNIFDQHVPIIQAFKQSLNYLN